jgi:glycosyltransferase involved in cell wall biosynthesis
MDNASEFSTPESMLLSIIIPAHNEAAVIVRCLNALLTDSRVGEIEIIVVCNGCSDNTAELARSFGTPVRVIESDVASKTAALNLGDVEAKGYPRFYMDADVIIGIASIRKIASVLEHGQVLAASPRPSDIFLPETAWAVRAYYSFWTSLPYIREGMIAAGIYALSRTGRSRFGIFPGLIADDGYVRLLFHPSERLQVADAVSEVIAPRTFQDLLKVRMRIRRGIFQLRELYPELMRQEAGTKHYFRALMSVLSRPSSYLPALVYGYVLVASWIGARMQLQTNTRNVWERDESSRRA